MVDPQAASNHHSSYEVIADGFVLRFGRSVLSVNDGVVVPGNCTMKKDGQVCGDDRGLRKKPAREGPCSSIPTRGWVRDGVVGLDIQS
jgi:hypothetical protein